MNKLLRTAKLHNALTEIGLGINELQIILHLFRQHKWLSKPNRQRYALKIENVTVVESSDYNRLCDWATWTMNDIAEIRGANPQIDWTILPVYDEPVSKCSMCGLVVPAASLNRNFGSCVLCDEEYELTND